MGVRGLTLRLKKSAIEQAIGCADSACHLRTGVVVDGPSLAYWVHATLVDALTADGHFQVWPPFNLIKETLLGFLEELEQSNVKILRIYFDGGLPTWKRPTRFHRLHQDLESRKTLKKRNPAGLELSISYDDHYSIENLFHCHDRLKRSQHMTTSPFLVPLIIESLLDSRFAARTEVIPEEADPWCAVFARNNEALILTDDSDLAIYDIGNGKVSFLGSLTKQRCERCTSIGIFTRILQPDRFALDFSTTDIKEAAYKLHVTTRSSSTEYTIKETFVDFSSKYICVDSNQDAFIRSMTRYLDPRLSEVAVQVLRPSDSQIVSMLPSLLDDPDKTSAWTASQSIRVFVYSLLLRMDDDYKDMTLVEFNDRTQPNTKGRFLDLLDERSLIRTASRLLSMLNSIREFLGRAQCSVTYWQTVCYIQVIYHNLALTPGMMKHLSGLLRKMSNGELSKMGWSEIHFQAQFEGTYYAFRQLYQTLYYLFPADDLAKLKSLSELKRTMVDFPSISEMFVGQSQVIAAEVDAKYVLDSASEMLDNQVDSDGPTLSQ